MTAGRRRDESRRGTHRLDRWLVVVGALVSVLLVGTVYAASHHTVPGVPTLSFPSEKPAPSPSATPSAQERRVAAPGAEVAAASRIFTLWARPGMRPARWWSALAPYLSAQGRQDLLGTDPAYLPRVRVHGTPTVVRRSNGVFAQVRVPTTRGAYVVDLVRPVASGGWRLDRIGFPGTAS